MATEEERLSARVRADRLDHAVDVQQRLLAITQAVAVTVSLILVAFIVFIAVALANLRRQGEQIQDQQRANAHVVCVDGQHSRDQLIALAAIANRLGLPVDFTIPPKEDC